MDRASGTLWLTATNERSNGPRSKRDVSLTSLSSTDLEQAVLVELRLDEGEREAAAVDRLVELLEHEGQRAVVVLVAVRDDEGEHVVAALQQPADVGEDEVDAEHLVARELDAAVEDHDLAAVLDGGHVLADLAEAAERDDPWGVVTHVESILSVQILVVMTWRRSRGPASFEKSLPAQLVGDRADSSGVAGTSGRRRPPTSWPRRLSASLTGMGLAVMKSVL